MFLDKDKARPLLYRVARQCFIDLQAAVGVAEGEHAGLHGLRVAGYNRTKAGGSVPTWRRRTVAGPRARTSATLDSHSLTSFASLR